MKRSIFILLSLLLILAYNSHGQAAAKKAKKSKDDANMSAPANYPYAVSYSSNFAIGNAELANKVLMLYRDYEKQDWSKDGWFADTVTVVFPDGAVLKGKEKVLKSIQDYRATMESTSFEMSAVTPLRSLDRNENWVSLWGVQTVMPGAGAASTATDFHAIWRWNADEKVDYIHFFQSQAPAKQ